MVQTLVEQINYNLPLLSNNMSATISLSWNEHTISGGLSVNTLEKIKQVIESM